MSTLYVYANSLLGDNGIDFSDDSCVDIIVCATNEECVAKFEEGYNINDYTASFTKHV